MSVTRNGRRASACPAFKEEEEEEEEEEERVADNQSPFKVVVLKYIHTYCESLYVKS